MNLYEKGYYNQNLVCINQIQKRFLCVHLLTLAQVATHNSTPRRFPSYLIFTLLLYFLFIFHLPRCTLPDFLSKSPHTSLPYLSCCHRTTTSPFLIVIDREIFSIMHRWMNTLKEFWITNSYFAKIT